MESTRKEILERGLAMELEASQFYRTAATRSENPGAKVMLNELADEEDRHAHFFREALAGRYQSFGTKAPGPRQDMGLERYLIGPEMSESSNPLDVLVVAIHAEAAAFRLYTEWADKLAGTPEEGLLRAIAAEEATHKARLEAMYDDEVMVQN